jgi:hypothetical protein
VFFYISEIEVVDNTDPESTEPTTKTPYEILKKIFGSPAKRFPHNPPGSDKIFESLDTSIHAK